MTHKIIHRNEIFTNNIINTNLSGAYGRIFVNNDKTKAIKIFYKKNDDLSERRQKHILETFNSEIEAYNLAFNDETLRQYIPSFYGKVKVNHIFDDIANTVDEDYYIDCAYKIEYIDGYFRKLGNDSYENKNQIISMFRELNINNLIDASVTEEDGNILKVIDFSMEDIEYFV